MRITACNSLKNINNCVYCSHFLFLLELKWLGLNFYDPRGILRHHRAINLSIDTSGQVSFASRAVFPRHSNRGRSRNSRASASFCGKKLDSRTTPKSMIPSFPLALAGLGGRESRLSRLEIQFCRLAPCRNLVLMSKTESVLLHNWRASCALPLGFSEIFNSAYSRES